MSKEHHAEENNPEWLKKKSIQVPKTMESLIFYKWRPTGKLTEGKCASSYTWQRTWGHYSQEKMGRESK